MRPSIVFAMIIAASLAACGDGDSRGRSEAEMAQVAERAATMRPGDPALAEIYDRSCRTCHAVRGSGAPLTGDAVAWAPRLAQGEDTLLDHTIGGYNGMPPLGMCPDCSAEQFRELIAFMSEDAGE